MIIMASTLAAAINDCRYITPEELTRDNIKAANEGYNTGYDFMRELLANHEKQQALKIANDYLDVQGHVYGTGTNFFKSNPEEYRFCTELYRATMDVKQTL